MTETPVSLLDRLCHSPDEQHWQRFILLFTPLLHRWAIALGVPKNDHEDVMQETFVTLIQELPNFEYEPNKSFRAWLWTVFRHRVLTWLKRQQRHVGMSIDVLEQLSSPDQVAEATEAEYRRVLLARMWQLMKRDFPERSWQMFTALMNGQSGVEVANAFGVTPNAVYLLRARIISRFQQEFANF